MRKQRDWEQLIGLTNLLGLIIFGTWYWAKHIPDTPEPTLKYKKGQIVYLKPDSTKAVVEHAAPNLQYYFVEYTDDFGKRHTIRAQPTSVY